MIEICVKAVVDKTFGMNPFETFCGANGKTRKGIEIPRFVEKEKRFKEGFAVVGGHWREI